jgi:hypothetical protein
MVVPHIIVVFAQMLAPFLMRVFRNLSDQSPMALGKMSFVVMTFGPMNTLSSIDRPSYMRLWFWILQLLPMVTFGPMYTHSPIMQLSPMTVFLHMCVNAHIFVFGPIFSGLVSMIADGCIYGMVMILECFDYFFIIEAGGRVEVAFVV